VRAPSATRVAHEIGCRNDSEVKDIDRWGDASNLENMCLSKYLSESRETKENELGRYEVYVVSSQLKGELGIALIDSGSMVSIIRESSVKRFRTQDKQSYKV
jgi:hypothetical protein